MSTTTVNGLFRYPVKSMLGESLDAVALTARGFPGDRAWAVRDEERGGIRGGKRFGALMQARSYYAEAPSDEPSPPAHIELPNGKAFLTTDPNAAAELSAFLESPVTLWPLLPADALDHYRRGAPLSTDMEAELRRVFARTPDEPLPDLSAFPREAFEFESPPGTYFDAFPLLIMSTNALDHLAAMATASRFDVRRFRPNLLVESDASGEFPENDWIGKRIRIGSAVIDVKMACPRCVMTTHPFADLPKDPRIMRTLVKHANGNLGVYATVVTPGRLRTGDAVELMEH
ncbi:MAG: MOSC domain-containing protein [Gammaproteobacteria bacterium]|nr:MOSC domain-containing protein [Gammaproteobacteria bacterium]